MNHQYRYQIDMDPEPIASDTRLLVPTTCDVSTQQTKEGGREGRKQRVGGKDERTSVRGRASEVDVEFSHLKQKSLLIQFHYSATPELDFTAGPS